MGETNSVVSASKDFITLVGACTLSKWRFSWGTPGVGAEGERDYDSTQDHNPVLCTDKWCTFSHGRPAITTVG